MPKKITYTPYSLNKRKKELESTLMRLYNEIQFLEEEIFDTQNELKSIERKKKYSSKKMGKFLDKLNNK